MAGSDWIKLHRAMLKSSIFQHDGLFRLWTYCLLRANWEPRKWLIPGTMQEIEVPRGAFITGRQSLFASLYPQSDADGILIKREYAPSPITVWRWIKSLESMGCVSVETVNNRCSMVTICNYSTYQDQKQTDDQVVNRSRSGGEQVVITNKEQQEFKKDLKTHTGGEELTGFLQRSPAFEQFMKSYPRPTSPEAAWQVWQAKVYTESMRHEKTDAEIEEIIVKAAQEFRDSPAGKPPDGSQDYRPAAAKWLQGNCWEEPRELWQQPNGKSTTRAKQPPKPTIKPIPKDARSPNQIIGDALMEAMK